MGYHQQVGLGKIKDDMELSLVCYVRVNQVEK